MRDRLLLCVLLSLGGCAIPPLTPEQAAYLRQNPLGQPVHQPYMLQPPSRQGPPAFQFQPNTQTAYFTGSRQLVRTITNQQGWQCQYRLGAQLFARVFVGDCPAAIEVQ